MVVSPRASAALSSSRLHSRSIGAVALHIWLRIRGLGVKVVVAIGLLIFALLLALSSIPRVVDTDTAAAVYDGSWHSRMKLADTQRKLGTL